MADYFETETQLSELKRCVDRHRDTLDHPTLPSQESIKAAEASLPSSQSASYLAGAPAEAVVGHITRDILPALNGQGRSGRYYGFWADGVVSHMDQNVQVHLPAQTVATAVEDKALEMLASLLRLGRGEWPGRTLTTGATGSNVLGLACGREAVLARRLGDGAPAVGELGILGACVRAGVEEIQVLTSAGHSSLSKAASVVGLGRQSVKELQLSDEEPWRLDFAALEEHLKRPRTASIIAISAGEVNTGRYGTYGLEEMKRVRALADQYGAWIHVDGAFGIFARVLEANDEYKLLHERVAGLELADSITVDGHKVLNVPYDCGMFFSRSLSTLQNVFVNPNAAYLASSSAATIPSP
uniref:L-2,4-diaminobutyrate decarboxylase n=1 Tax=Bionectria ochroleuca TaxID=29856 RepID=A0A8H7NG69_BIOOC